jgi:nucleoside-diphosphate-sugar epimerase
MTRTVVAGGAGFVGSHLCEALLARGEAVLCLDDLSTGRLDNLAHLRAHPRFALVRGDVADAQLWRRCRRPGACTSWPARPARPTTSACRYRPSAPTWWARSTP